MGWDYIFNAIPAVSPVQIIETDGEIYNPMRGTVELDLASALNTAFGRGARKRLACEAGVPIETAKNWLEGRYPACRKPQLTDLLIRRVETQQRVLDEIRRAALGSRDNRRRTD